MSLVLFLVFGLVVGLVARFVMPGRQSMGLVATMLLGVAGSFVGGMIGSLFFGGNMFDLHPTGLIGSVVGSLLVMFIVGLGSRRGAWA